MSRRIKIGEERYDEAAFLANLRLDCSGNVDKYDKIRAEFVRYQLKEGKYAVDETRINKDSPNEVNEMFWKDLKVLFRNAEDKDPLLFIQIGMDCTRKPCGIAAVESSFSPLKIIQTAKRAALSYKKTCKLLFIYNNYRFLKNFR